MGNYKFHSGRFNAFNPVYRSHVSEHVQSPLWRAVSQASIKNEISGITGILLFDGTHFFQLLEGPKMPSSPLQHHLPRSSSS